MDESGRLARAVIQNAESSRLLGVPFVPVYRVGHAQAPEATPEPAGATPRMRPSPETRATVVVTVADPFGDAAPCATGLDIKPLSREPRHVQGALDELRARYELDAPHRHFVTDHHSIVFGEGDPCARLMFVGEAPGAEEDRTGRPFVGRAGQLLDKMIGAMGLGRAQVYIANVLKTRPPENATPTSEEIRLCAPYLFQQIAIIAPEVIVCLGLPATRALLETAESMSRLRGRWSAFNAPPPCARAIPVMPTYHPAFLLRSYTEENRAKVWSDLRQVMDRLGLARSQAAVGGMKPR